MLCGFNNKGLLALISYLYLSQDLLACDSKCDSGVFICLLVCFFEAHILLNIYNPHKHSQSTVDTSQSTCPIYYIVHINPNTNPLWVCPKAHALFTM